MEQWKGGPWRSRGERKRVRIPKIYSEDQTVAAAQFRIKSVIDRLVDIIKIGVMGSMWNCCSNTVNGSRTELEAPFEANDSTWVVTEK
jgi:hypothetical protein